MSEDPSNLKPVLQQPRAASKFADQGCNLFLRPRGGTQLGALLHHHDAHSQRSLLSRLGAAARLDRSRLPQALGLRLPQEPVPAVTGGAWSAHYEADSRIDTPTPASPEESPDLNLNMPLFPPALHGRRARLADFQPSPTSRGPGRVPYNANAGLSKHRPLTPCDITCGATHFGDRMLAACPDCPLVNGRDAVCRLADFVLMRQIDQEPGAKLHLARHTPSGTPVTLKIYFKHQLASESEVHARQCIEIHSALEHSHLLRMLAAFEDAEHIVMVYPYAVKIDSYDSLGTELGFPDDYAVVRTVIAPLLAAVTYLHRHGVVHGDLRLKNVFMTSDGVVKVGLSSRTVHATMSTPAGAGVRVPADVEPLSPELLCCIMAHGAVAADPAEARSAAQVLHGARSAAADAWALGVLIYKLLLHASPFAEATVEDTVRAVLGGAVTLPAQLSKATRDLLQRALHKDVQQRASVEELQRLAELLLLQSTPSQALERRPVMPAAVEDFRDLFVFMQSASPRMPSVRASSGAAQQVAEATCGGPAPRSTAVLGDGSGRASPRCALGAGPTRCSPRAQRHDVGNGAAALHSQRPAALAQPQ